MGESVGVCLCVYECLNCDVCMHMHSKHMYMVCMCIYAMCMHVSVCACVCVYTQSCVIMTITPSQRKYLMQAVVTIFRIEPSTLSYSIM